MKILIADDNPDTAEVCSLVLESLGHATQFTLTGQGAVDLALADRPDLCILDIGLPDLSGFEVCKQLRWRFGPLRPTIVALTGWGDSEYRTRAREAGFNHFLLKPVGYHELKALAEDADLVKEPNA